MVGLVGGGLFFGLLLVVGLVLLAVLAVRLVGGGLAPRDHDTPSPTTRGPAPATPDPAPDGDAQRLLDERYARGEIGTDEYLQRRRHLGGAG